MRLAVIWLVAAATACAARQPAAVTPVAGEHEVVILIFSHHFQPATLSVPVGTTVTWINKDTTPHTATRVAAVEPFDSGSMGNNTIYSHTFSAAGRYGYRCVPHAGMQATIVVE